MDVFNAFKGIADMIRDAVEGAMPRQAVVTRSEGSGVWVRYTPVNTSVPEMWFPSSIAGLPAGTSGWVHPLAGGKGRFIATAVVVPIPFVRRSAHVLISTTSTSTYERADLGAPIPVPNGRYRLDAMLTVPFRRTASGTVWIRGVANSDAYGSERVFNPDLSPWQLGQIATIPVEFNGTIVDVENGTVQIAVDARGGGAAGTTSLYNVGIQGTLTRIGDIT